MSRFRPPPSAAAGKQLRLERTLLIVGVLALGFNLRISITNLPPVFPELQSSLGLSSATVSVLAATPVICFAVVSGFAAGLARRAGEERVLLGAILALTVGLAARGLAPGALLFPGTVVAGSAIAVMNVLLASLIKRRWPERAGFLIGLYITALSVGAIVGSLVSVPLWNATGGSVALTLGWAAGPAALGVLIWGPQALRLPVFARLRPTAAPGSRQLPSPAVRKDHGARKDPVSRPARVPVHRYAVTWYVTAFMGLQSLLYYATLSWLPTMLRDRGASAAWAGDLTALMGVGNLCVSLIVPVAAQRLRSQVVLVVPTALALGGGLAALLYAPLGGAAAWALLLGAGQNAALALAIFFTAAKAPHAAAAASLSSLAQAVGYLLASTGPLEVGLLHAATGSWTAPVMVLFAVTGVVLVAGVLAAAAKPIPDTADAPPAAATAAVGTAGG